MNEKEEEETKVMEEQENAFNEDREDHEQLMNINLVSEMEK